MAVSPSPAPRAEPRKPGASRAGTTFEQRALWYIQTLEPTCAAYNSALALELHFSVDVASLEKAVRSVVADHGVLRSVFRSDSLGEVHRYHLAEPPEIPCFEVSPDDLRRDELFDVMSALSKRPFRLDREPPFRAVLFPGKTAPDHLLVVMHHIAADAFAHVQVVQEILQRYASVTRDERIRPVDAKPEPIGIAERQRAYLASHRAQEDREYWREELAGLSGYLELTPDLPTPPAYRYEGAEVPLDLGLDLLDAVEDAAAAADVTSFAYLISVYQVLLYRFSGQCDFVVGYPVSSRRGTLDRHAIEFFAALLPLRCRIDADAGFDRVLRETWTRLSGGLRHRAFPHALLPWPAELVRDPRRPGPVTALFAYAEFPESHPLAGILVPGRRVEIAGLTVSSPGMPQQHGQFELAWDLERGPQFVQAQLKYNTSLFTRETAQRMSTEYTALLHAAVAGKLPASLSELRSA